jgi:hypothetical protein
MADLDVQAIPAMEGLLFRVKVEEGGDGTSHEVAVPEDYFDDLTGSVCTPEEFVKVSFEFLLEREPKESILREFEITVISRYFPDYEAEMRDRFTSSAS